MTPSLVGLVCAALLVASYMSGHGNIHKLSYAVKTVVDPQEPDLLATDTGPGGQNPIRLTRSATSIGKDVEFLSATLLPGRGMNVFQITAMVPGHGEVSLLQSPAVETVASQMTGRGDDAHGEASMAMGGAFLMPWVGKQTARQTDGPSGTTDMLSTEWNGGLLHFPAFAEGGTTSVDGLFLDRKSSSVKSDVLPDGQYAQAVFHPAFGAPWPSAIDATVTVGLSAHTLDLTVSATNTGPVPVPLAIGWHPLFVVPSGDRADAVLRLPSNTVLAVNRATGLPTGKTTSTDGTALDLSRANGGRLGSMELDEVYTHLKPSESGGQPVAELRDPAYNLSLQVVPMSANIAYLHVTAPADKKWVSIGPNTSVPDAFGPEWKPQDSGITMLAPGATMQWKVRLSIAAISGGEERVH